MHIIQSTDGFRGVGGHLPPTVTDVVVNFAGVGLPRTRTVSSESMGSVLAAASPSPAPAAAGGSQGVQGLASVPPGFTMPPLSSGLPASGQPMADADPPLPNPGTYEECHRKCKELFPPQMEGVRLVVNKGLSNHFQVSHTVTLSTLGESGYRFGSTYVGTKQTGPAESFPVIVGDMDNTGSLNSQIIHQLASAVRTKIAIQTQQHKFVNWQCDMEWRGEDFTSAVTLGNPDVLVGSGILVGHYLQSITPALALGGEVVYHRRPGEEGVVTSLLGRYTGTVDSNWVVGATLEKKLLPLPLTLALGAFLNHRKNKFQCGFGVTIG
ncbi:Mitochondrial import receptor subunit TOM40 [Liparis tanakae]|uniref:Mitochondrial import receptor subunit TOM40 n=1 Tax=Liparis tanakae TaxID=230148 RepID=A0A4Z2JHT5_9TELE|nr:Mitochondrial import receptor subunit TOM40 [Liparis tanakae]